MVDRDSNPRPHALKADGLPTELSGWCKCVCGDIEIVQHFILECPLYEDNRQKLQKNLFLQLGIPYLDMDLLLGYSENENLSGWRESVICELEQYTANTGCLFSRVADGSAPQ